MGEDLNYDDSLTFTSRGNDLLSSYYGNLSTVSVSDSYTINPGSSTTVSISDVLRQEFQESMKTQEILGDIEDFCDNFCFFKREEICDSEIKSSCPLWCRLKCEKRRS